MRYQLEIAEEALEQLRALRKELRQRIGQKLDALQTDLQGDVKKLAGQAGKYRLRVGSHRVLFTLEKDQICVYLVKDRKNAYRD
ncbi:MAG: type II toxin-antitoxin system RelE/ParE family toxin [Lacunisphaera sp.]